MVIMDPENHEVDALQARLPAGRGRVLEIGCGDGRLTHRYAAHVDSVLAIEPDESLTAAFRAAGVEPNVDLRTMGIEHLTPAAASFEVVLFSWSL